MSLLLEALKRAEEDSKKRKLMDAGVPMPGQGDQHAAPVPALGLEPTARLLDATPAVPEPASFAEFTLEEQVKPAEPLDVPKSAAMVSAPAIDANSLDFVLPSDDEPSKQASAPAVPLLAPRKPAHPYGRYEKPADRPTFEDSNWGALVSSPVRSRRPGSEDGAISSPSPMRPAPRKLAEATADRHTGSRGTEPVNQKSSSVRSEASLTRPAATPRQALAAAGILAGIKKGKAGSPGERRRQMILVVALVLIALPIGTFLFFGEALLGSPSSLAVRTPPPLPPAAVPELATSPAVAETFAPASSAASADVGIDAAPAPLPPGLSPAVPAIANAAPLAPPSSRSQRAQSVSRSGPVATARQRVTQDAARANAAETPANSSVSQVRNSSRPASQMDAAYAAYQAGNSAEAARLYREVLKVDATQRDAWLGLAVIAHASNQLEPAMDAYRRVLRLEPQNATALAGVSSLGRAASEPQQESRLREMLARAPQEADLNQALGLYLSGEQRWSEAQPLFFKAHSLAPQEPEFAYNLAVALDHMRRSTLAAQYYETALGLAQGKAAGFDEAAARSRLAALRAAR